MSASGGNAGKRRRVSRKSSKAELTEEGLPDHYAAVFRTFCRMDTGYSILRGRLRHIGLRTLVSVAQDTTEEDVLRLVSAAPTVYELYWKQDVEPNKLEMWSTRHRDADEQEEAPSLQCRRGYGGAAPQSQVRRRTEVLRCLQSRLASEREKFLKGSGNVDESGSGATAEAVTPSGGRQGTVSSETQPEREFDPATAEAIPPAEWPPRPLTEYSHLSGSLTRKRRPSSSSAGSPVNGVGSAVTPSPGGASTVGSPSADLDGTTPKFNPEATLRELQSLPLYTGQVVHVERVAGSPAKFETLDRPLPSGLQSTLDAAGLGSFFAHQAEGINVARKGGHLMLCTSTSSGKSLVYNTTVIDDLLSRPPAVAFYVFPTKALAQDQLRALQELVGYGWLGDDVRPATYDGDLPQAERAAIRTSANIFLTNPDTLHLTVMPHHGDWARHLAHVRYVVIDEAHIYRGLFGSHVSCILRRFWRLCCAYGNPHVQFICCSATLANPSEHADHLIPSRPITVVTEDGSASGDRVFALWNPVKSTSRDVAARAAVAGASGPAVAKEASPIAQTTLPKENPLPLVAKEASATAQVTPMHENASSAAAASSAMAVELESTKEMYDEPCSPSDATAEDPTLPKVEKASGEEDDPKFGGSSSILEASLLLSSLVQLRVKTLVFCTSRKLTELVLTYTQRDLAANAPGLVDKVKSYRAGFTKEARRVLEKQLFSGELLGVTATCALELGVDVGALDCTLLLGFPGSIASMWQQAGRSGRNAKDALSIMVLFRSPADQFYAEHPSMIFGDGVEEAAIDPTNYLILDHHLVCAASEVPFLHPNSATGGAIPTPTPRHAARGPSGASDAQGDAGIGSAATCGDYRSLDLFGPAAVGMAGKLLELQHLTHEVVRGEGLLVATSTLARGMSASRSIRVIENRTVRILREADKRELDEIPFNKAFFHVYPGAILLNQGTEYLITSLDEAELVAHARPVKVNYYTKCRDMTDVQVFSPISEVVPRGGGCALRLGQATVHTQWFGFRKHSKRTKEILSLHTLVLPSAKYTSRAVWVTIPARGLAAIRRQGLDLMHAIHAAQHLLVRGIFKFVRHDPRDVDTEHAYPFQTRARPNHLVVHDTAPGGTGVAAAVFKHAGWRLVAEALAIGRECGCDEGCPRCVHSARCSEYNEAICKQGALVILQSIQDAVEADEGGVVVEGEDEGDWLPDGTTAEAAGYVKDEWALRVARAKQRKSSGGVDPPSRKPSDSVGT